MSPVVKENSKRIRSGAIHYIHSRTLQTKLLLLLIFIALAWLCITLTLLPSSIESIKSSNLIHHLRNPHYREDESSLSDHETYKSKRKTLSMVEIKGRLQSFLQELHDNYAILDPAPPVELIWKLYKDAVERWLVPMDRNYDMVPVREDNSIFVNIVSYRDEYCTGTLRDMFAKADYPDRVFVGLVQQNCFENCSSGVLDGDIVIETLPDENCYEAFCNSFEGKNRCGENGQVRHLLVNESESLGPFVSRYLAVKLWNGENYYMQVDSHSEFAQGWDTQPITDLRNTPSYPYSILTHYPPDRNNPEFDKPGKRICGAAFSDNGIENMIIRLTVCDQFEETFREVPCRAPFVGGGYVFGHSSFLSVVPFDPYPAWVFTGEEILYSLRLHTWGYDLYSPTHNKVSHYYVRQHKPKFWEAVGRLFQKPFYHNTIQKFVIERVKHLLGYPESTVELVDGSLLANIDFYGLGPFRLLSDYMNMAGLDPMAKEAHFLEWCYKCQEPKPSLPYPFTAT